LITVTYRIVVAPTATMKVAARATPMMHSAVLTFLRSRFRKQKVTNRMANPKAASFTMKAI
jgi:hypothetical protein